jgi:hypothetical protein
MILPLGASLALFPHSFAVLSVGFFFAPLFRFDTPSTLSDNWQFIHLSYRFESIPKRCDIFL